MPGGYYNLSLQLCDQLSAGSAQCYPLNGGCAGAALNTSFGNNCYPLTIWSGNSYGADKVDFYLYGGLLYYQTLVPSTAVSVRCGQGLAIDTRTLWVYVPSFSCATTTLAAPLCSAVTEGSVRAQSAPVIQVIYGRAQFLTAQATLLRPSGLEVLTCRHYQILMPFRCAVMVLYFALSFRSTGELIYLYHRRSLF